MLIVNIFDNDNLLPMIINVKIVRPCNYKDVDDAMTY